MRPNLVALARELVGTKFGEFVLLMVQQGSLEQALQANMLITAELGFELDDAATWIDTQNPKIYLETFWAQDCDRAIREISADAVEFLRQHGAADPDESRVSAMFELIVLNFVYGCHKQSAMKKYIKTCCVAPAGTRSNRPSLWGKLAGKVRCPLCGAYRKHPRDRERETAIRELEHSEFARGFRKVSGSAKASDRAFICMACGHRFDLDTEIVWADTAKKLGDEQTIAEYGKLQGEHERE